MEQETPPDVLDNKEVNRSRDKVIVDTSEAGTTSVPASRVSAANGNIPEERNEVEQKENSQNNNSESLPVDNHAHSREQPSHQDSSQTSSTIDSPKMDSSEDSDDTVIEHIADDEDKDKTSEDEDQEEDSEENVVAASMQISLDGKGPVTQQISMTGSNRSSPVKEATPDTRVASSGQDDAKTPSSHESRASASPQKQIDMKSSAGEKKLSLPETVSTLTTPEGGTVYLVGTAHFSLESQEDVAKTIQTAVPDIVLVELCKGRVNILQLDEKTLLEEAKNITLDKIRQVIRQSGLVQGVMYILLLNLSAHLTKQLGMAPGGEFRRAFSEAKQIPGCLIHLGDRPIQITLQRALAALPLLQKIRLGWKMLTSNDPISKEEVEKCKQRDLLEEMLAEMTGEFPALSEVFVKERDMYLAYSLRSAAKQVRGYDAQGKPMPPVVVGVVGIGHIPGIIENWGKVEEADIAQLMLIPPPSMMGKVLKTTAKVVFIGGLCYLAYRMLPQSLIKDRLPTFSLPVGLKEWKPPFL